MSGGGEVLATVTITVGSGEAPPPPLYPLLQWKHKDSLVAGGKQWRSIDLLVSHDGRVYACPPPYQPRCHSGL